MPDSSYRFLPVEEQKLMTMCVRVCNYQNVC